MANEQNLRPSEYKLSQEEAKRGGIASGEARRKKKTMREQAILLLSLANKNSKIEKVMDELGIDKEDQTNQMAMIISMLNKTISKGDVQAFNSLQATIGEKPIEKIEVSKPIDDTIKEVDEYLCQKN